MRLLHTMIRVGDLERSIAFYTGILGMKVLRRKDYPDGRFTLAFVGYGSASGQWWRHGRSHMDETQLWLLEDSGGRRFRQLAGDGAALYSLIIRSSVIIIGVPPPADTR